jgi:hypothetical protein
MIAGGYFSSIYHGKIPHDIDVYVFAPEIEALMVTLCTMQISNKPAKPQSNIFAAAIAAGMATDPPDIITQSNISYMKNKNIRSVFTVAGRFFKGKNFPNVQFIFSSYQSRTEVLAEFDYAHCTISYQHGKLFMTPIAWDAMVRRKLVVNNPDMVQEERKEKFCRAGFEVVS